jgi:AraC family transcriptional regulator
VAEHAIGSDRRQAVDRAIDHILGHLATPLDLATVAAVAGYSPWHFQRVFAATMSESPTQFVARARVERAVALARAEPDRPWFDIAVEVGFGSASQLSRAFRSRFGTTARSWDRRTPLVDRSVQPVLADLPPVDVEDVTFPVAVTREPAYRFAYLRVAHPYASDHLARAWDTVEEWRTSTKSQSLLIGMSWDDPATVPADACRYDLGVALDPVAERPGWASERWMPSTVAAVVRVDGDLHAVDSAWECLHRIWIPSSSRRRAPLPSIERFHADPRPAWTSWSLECIVPLVPGRSSASND